MAEHVSLAEQFRPLTHPPTDLDEIANAQGILELRRFTSDDAWAIGCELRSRLRHHSKGAAIGIFGPYFTTAAAPQVLFHATTKPGVPPDNDTWIARKVRTVLRFGVSTWEMHWRFAGDEDAFRAKNGFGDQEAGQYAIWGGGVPIKVQGVEGIVAVVAISG
ncbi:hypothetical protein CNMCM8927_001289 [Aspergillus lentulus]|uniref:Uncharacterized protein n=1 Tax=Aspergillus lentulus TaxID=293939 RepID=A0AAN5YHY6_ASPLE|nr:hypothetical protein CNMCM8927_001289 [Aspergillus lentulus]